MRSLELGLASRNARRECEKRDENWFSFLATPFSREMREITLTLKPYILAGLSENFSSRNLREVSSMK